MVSVAKVVSVILTVLGSLAVMIGFFETLGETMPPGSQATQFANLAGIFSGLILIALGLGLYMLAYIAKEPAEQYRQEVDAAQATPRAEESAAYAAEHQVGARPGPRN
jgi:uncharacterized membrane protein